MSAPRRSALATAYIPATLGGRLFTLKAAGYLVAAVAIVGWYLTGPRYDVAHLAKAIEVGLIEAIIRRA